MRARYLIIPLLLAALASTALAQQCPSTTDVATYPNPPLTYPMTSNRYAVQYQLGGAWTDAQVYISYYGGTNSSPMIAASHYPPDTSMSFASIPAAAGAAVVLRVTKLFGSAFPSTDHVSVRPRAKAIHVDSVSGNTVQLSTNTAADFAGEQFVLWWDGDDQQSSAIQGLAFFLNPPYQRPTGSNVKTIGAPADLTGDLSHFDTLDFEGIVAIGGPDPEGPGAQAFIVPANIDNVFLAPGAWVQGKLRFEQGGAGHMRRTLNGSNNAIIASLMVPGTNFGTVIPSVYRNIYVEDPPRVLFSLKILPPDCELHALPTCPVVDLSQPSVLNLYVENLFTPASIVENSIGFQTVNGSNLTGSMNIGFTNVVITEPDGTTTPLTSGNAATVGMLATNGDNINLQYNVSPDFALALDQPAVNASAGTKVSVTVTINRLPGFAGTVTVTPPSVLPRGVKLAGDAVSTTGTSAAFKIKIKGSVQPGVYHLTFAGTDSSGGTGTATLTLNIQ